MKQFSPTTKLFALYFLFIIVFSMQTKALTYNVTVPIGTEACYIVGEFSVGYVSTRMTKIDDLHYTVDIPEATTNQWYEYLSGPTWAYEQVDANGISTSQESWSANDIVVGWKAVCHLESAIIKVQVPTNVSSCYIVTNLDNWVFLPESQSKMTLISSNEKSNTFSVTLTGIADVTYLSYRFSACFGWDNEQTNPFLDFTYTPDSINIVDTFKGIPTSYENRVVFMGNSITQGWIEKHHAFFSDNFYINRGISGQTTGQMLRRFQRDVIDHHPKAVVILGGTNDIAGNDGPRTLVQIRDTLAAMAELAEQNGIRVILCSVLPAYDYWWSPGMHPDVKIPQLNTLIKTYCESKNFAYIDYFTSMADDKNALISSYTYDGVHPTLQGYSVMESIIQPVLQGIINGVPNNTVSNTKIRCINKSILLENINSPVDLYDLSGSLLTKSKDAINYISKPLSAGVYIVKTNKFVNKVVVN